MVKSVISYKINGLSNWMVQRISALIMTAYLIFMVDILWLIQAQAMINGQAPWFTGNAYF